MKRALLAIVLASLLAALAGCATVTGCARDPWPYPGWEQGK